MRNLTLICCSIFLALGAANAGAQESSIPPSPIVKTSLVLDADHLQDEGVAWAGVHFTIPEHWHIYWLNPGDSGIPTTYQWTLPVGITAGSINWPAPERLETSGLITYGYSGDVTLPVPLTVSDAKAHGALDVTAKWLVCRDICIPESATFHAKLPSATPDAKKLLEDAVLKVPQPAVHSAASYQASEKGVVLSVQGPEILSTSSTPITGALFIPEEDGILANAEPQPFTVSDDHILTLNLKRGTQDPVQTWHGVLRLTRDHDIKDYAIAAELHTGPAAAAAAATPAAPVTTPTTGTDNLLTVLALAFIGGLILNIMPCVLPILALKALAITKKAQASRKQAAHQGLAYAGGVIASFLAIAGVMLALKASGQAIGWGFQLQHSGFVGFLMLVMLLVAANLLGLFELPVLFGTRATQANDDKINGSFLTGALAVLVATPCTAPFMATAIGATLALPAAAALSVFAMLGLGMASPFLLISFWPAARRILPKPGAWMNRFKHILAIPVLLTALWLGFVLVQLQTPMQMPDGVNHTRYSAEALQQLRDEGTPVLVDATAAWCLSCKVNERVALGGIEMQKFLRDHHVTLMVADWTMNDPAITAYLTSFGRGGVPLYVYYPPHEAPRLLPQILTPAIVREAIEPPHE